MYKLRKVCYIVLLFFCSNFIAAHSQEIYILDTMYPVHNLKPHIQILEDSIGHLSKEDMLNFPPAAFKQIDQFETPLKASSVYWSKLQITSETDVNNWLLVFEHRHYSSGGWGRGNGKVDVYAFRENKLIWHKKTGSSYPAREKEIQKRWNSNRTLFSIASMDTVQLVIRVEANDFRIPPQLNLTIRHPSFQYYQPLYNKYTFLNKFLLGVIFITLFYHLLLFLYLRQKVYLWFSIWLLMTFVTITINIDVGILHEFILPDYPDTVLPMWLLSANCVWFVFWFFGRSFVKTRVKYPVIDKAILVLASILFIELIVNIILLSSNPGLGSPNPSVHFMILSLLTFAGLILALILSFKKDKLARYFGLGAVIATLAPMIGGLWVRGIIGLPFDPFVWGVFLQVLVYSFGLAYRQQLKEKAFIRTQNDLLQAERSAMEVKRMKDLDEMKSRFFTNISHEFRTPLTLIQGPLQQVSRDATGRVVLDQDKYDMIMRNSTRLQALVDQLLELSRIETGYIGFSYTKANLYQFLSTVASDFKYLAENKKIDITINLENENTDAIYDKEKLQIILVNLLSNCMKYTPEKGSVSLYAKCSEAYIHLEITNSGKPLSQYQVEKIFDRFYRAESNEVKGTGIGLALTKELIEVLNGKISVTSDGQKGTTFKIKLPAAAELLPPSTDSSTNLTRDHVEKYGTSWVEDSVINEGSKKILVVEDNKDLQDYIKSILQCDYDVFTANDGIIGLEKAVNILPDVIVSDIMMPGMDGNELCLKLKSNIKTSHIPIILLTAKAGKRNKLDGLIQGADAYMTKPFDAEELLVRINNLITSKENMIIHLEDLKENNKRNLIPKSIEQDFLRKVKAIVQEHLGDEKFTVEILATQVGFSRSQLHRKLKAITGKSANYIIREYRLLEANEILKARKMTVSETAYAVGYSNLSYFTKSFKEKFGYLPSEI